MDSTAPHDDISVGDVFTPQADITQPSTDNPTNQHAPDVHMGDRLSPRKDMANYLTNRDGDMKPPALNPDLLTGKARRKKKKKAGAPSRSSSIDRTRLRAIGLG